MDAPRPSFSIERVMTSFDKCISEEFRIQEVVNVFEKTTSVYSHKRSK